MNPKINLSKIKKCNQIWDSMELCESGRLCKKCNNVIFDFRGKTEWEIALKHAQSDKKVCGIYDTNALVKNKRQNFVQSSKRNIVVAGTVGLLTTSSVAISQTNEKKLRTEIPINVDHLSHTNTSNTQNTKIKGAYNNQIDSVYIVSGILKDDTGEPLIGGTILVKGTEKGVFTDIDGYFLVEIAEELFELDTITIITSYIGYGRKEVAIHKNEFNQMDEIDLKIVLDEQVELSVFTVKRTPLHKRIWYKIRNLFKKKEK